MPRAKSIMANANKTGWFAARALPVREGVYERRMSATPYSCWNGRAWNADAETSTAAAKQTKSSSRQRVAWRGLVTPTDAPCATCKGHTVIDHGFDHQRDIDLIVECPDC